MNLIEVFITLLTIILSFIFSSFETAILYYPEYKIEKLKIKELIKLKRNISETLISILIGNNLVNIVLSVILSKISLELFGRFGIVVATVVATFLIITFGEIIPKNLAIKNPELILKNFYRIIYVASKILYPISYIYVFLSKIFKTSENYKESLSRRELLYVIEKSLESGHINKLEKKILERILHLSELTVSSIKKPLDDFIVVEKREKIKDVKESLSKKNVDYILVYEDKPENIIGYINVDDLIKIKDLNDEIGKYIQKPKYIPVNMKIIDLLSIFIKNKVDLLVVVDEYGNCEGIITFEDFAEDILAIPDEDLKIKRKESEIIVDGDENVSDINDAYNLNLPIPKEYGYSTIAGLILSKLGRIPKKGEKIRINGYVIEILDSDEKRINKVKIIL